MTISGRWLLLAALLVSGVLWLAVSSVTANAIHILAKSNFLWRGFGSVSIWLIIVSLTWLAIVGYVFTSDAQLTGKSLVLSLCAVAVWVATLAVLTALGDDLFGKLGAGAIVIWLVELAAALFVVNVITRPLLALADMGGWLTLIVMTLTWLMAAKALLLCFSPGVVLMR